MPGGPAPRPVSTALWLVLGCWIGANLALAWERLVMGPAWERLAVNGLCPRAVPFRDLPVLPYPRALRQAHAVGPRKALDVARYLWEEGPDADVTAVPGVGESTAIGLREALDRLGTPPGS